MFFKRCLACNFIKKRLQHRCFRTLFFTELLRWLLLREIDQISNSNKCCSLPWFPISLYNHYGPLHFFFSRSFTAQISRCVISYDYKLTSFQTSQEKPEITGQCLRFFLRIIFGKLNSFVE